MVSLIGLDCSNGQPTPQPAVVFKAKGRTARIQFKVGSSTVQSTVFHLYRLKDQAFQRIMYFDAGAKTGKNDPGVPSKYSGSVNADVVTLTISALELSDAGTYYCASWSGDNTVLTVKGNHEKGKDQVKAPTLFGYLPSKKDEKKSDGHGKQTMLCQASGMFPDLVKFAWKKKDAGKWGDVSEGDVVEQRNDGQEVTVTSMLIVDKDKARNDDYQCTVVHEGKTKELEMKRGNLKKL
uniref:Ig-like domain-containing protein n=1 Tax=Cyprinus carpio carpio TaxID=630221 RepID=A0A9J8CJ44_CYPCA